MSTSGLPERLGSAIFRRRVDLIAIAGLVLIAFAFLSPALKDGPSFGGFDFDLSLTPLTSGLLTHVHNPFNGDAVSQMIAWNSLDWQIVHHGQFPLWNQYSVLGMPQFFNFESSVLSLPDLLSYLVPLRFAFLVVVFVKLLLAGTGVYFFGRVLRLHPVACFLAGITFMFSGAFVNWVTWPLSDVAAWSGWICALAVLAYRSTRPRRYVVGLAVTVAFSVFGGFPEANVMFAIVLVVLIVVTGVAMLIERRPLSMVGAVRVGIGGIGGVALSAPLWLPGLQVISLGHRTQEGHYAGLPLRSLPLLFSQGFFGLPIGSSAHQFQLQRWNYYETVAYVGIAAVVLVLCALLISWRRPIVPGLFVALVVSLAITYEPAGFHPLQTLLAHSSELSAIRFERMRVFSAFVIAVLVGIGFDALVHLWSMAYVRRRLFVASVLAAVCVMLALAATLQDHLLAVARTQRLRSLIWPVVLVGIIVALALWALRSKSKSMQRLLLGVVCIGQGVFLFFAGVGIPSYASSVFPRTPAVTELQRIVGTTLVGLDGGNTTNVRLFSHIGFYPNINIGYHIRLFGVHDPLIPTSYFVSWPFPAAAPQKFGVGLFVPDIDTVALAQRYGIGYVLVAPHLVGPAGMTKVAVLDGERLYRVPGSSQFSFVNGSGARVLSISTTGDGEFVLHVAAKDAQRLICRVTDLNGWQATIDQRNVKLTSYDHVMFSVMVPAGRHVIVLRYWPRRFSEGLVLALVAIVLLLAYLIGVDRVVRPRVRSLAFRSKVDSRRDPNFQPKARG